MRTHEAFKAAYGGHKGVNFMTPNIIREGKVGSLHYELSEGRGFDNQPIFGVTVVEETEGGRHAALRPDLSTVFQSKAEAEHYIASL